MNAKRPLTPGKYYRLPWNLADNSITWLEPTTKCNLYCEGCYRENDPDGHKPLEQVIRDLEQVRALRRTDGISIAGGEPLIYPDIVELVRYVAAQGWKPIINSNGQALTPTLVRDLTKAGLVGFTMHVDSHQKRPGWIGKTEAELCELRLKLAEMIHEHSGGKVACAFNATIYRDTLDDIPMLTRWAQDHIDTVQTMVYILFRSAKAQWNFDVHVGGREVKPSELVYQLDHMETHKDIVAQEIADKIREDNPEFEPCAYLNGTEDPRTMKWLLTLRVGDKNRILGYLNPKFAELIQVAHHLFCDTYLAYTRPWLTNIAQAMFPLALINKSVRKIFGRWLKEPSKWADCLHIQSIMIIQPCDVFADGRQNMCDGCPDAIHYKGKMVWSCRVDELEKFGGFISCTPRGGCCGGAAPAQDAPASASAPKPPVQPDMQPEAQADDEQLESLPKEQAAVPVKVEEHLPSVKESTLPTVKETPLPAVHEKPLPAVSKPAAVPANVTVAGTPAGPAHAQAVQETLVKPPKAAKTKAKTGKSPKAKKQK